MKFTSLSNTLFVILGFTLCLLSSSCRPVLDSTTTEKDKIASEEDIKSLYDAIENKKELVLEKMVYYLDDPIRISNKNEFMLDGAGSTFIMKNKSEDVIFIESSTNITLKNFKATHVEPEGPIGCTGSVIQSYGNKNLSVENCKLNGSGIIGIVAYDTKNLKVLKNYIYNNSKYGVLYQGSTTLEIIKNTFENNGANGNDHVAKALDPGLSQVVKIEKGTNKEGVKMYKNSFR